MMHPPSPTIAPASDDLEHYRSQLTGYCYRMLGSPFDAQDAVQECFVRAWRSSGHLRDNVAFRSWLYRIATNVCLDMLRARDRRARPMDLGPAREPVADNLNALPETTWIEPAPEGLLAADGDPAELAMAREGIRLAFVAALQHLPPRQRAVLILCEVLHWQAAEAAKLLDTSVASVNSALQRARTTLATADLSAADTPAKLDDQDQALLERYVSAFEQYDIERLATLIHEDAQQSMPPYDLWLRGRDDIFTWWLGPGIGCAGSRVIPVGTANGSPAYGQYKPSPEGGYEPWAIQVVEISAGKISELTFFLGTARLFPMFGLPDRLEA